MTVCVLCPLVWRVVHSSLHTPPLGCGNLEIRTGIARRAIRAVGSGSAPRPPRSLARAPGDGLSDENQLAVDVRVKAPTGLPALEVGYRVVSLPIFYVGVVVPDPVYVLDLVRALAEPRLHLFRRVPWITRRNSAEDDVSYPQVITPVA